MHAHCYDFIMLTVIAVNTSANRKHTPNTSVDICRGNAKITIQDVRQASGLTPRSRSLIGSSFRRADGENDERNHANERTAWSFVP